MPFDYSIIGAGFIGNYIHEKINGRLYDRNSVALASNTEHDVLVISAPTGNRLQVNQDTAQDFLDCQNLVENISRCKYRYLVHISTVDVYSSRSSKSAVPSKDLPITPYGQNRLWLENQLQILSRCHTIRLPSLIDKSIQKNILFDLKNSMWLEKINLDSSIQWYPLNRILEDINQIVSHGIRYENLVSSPVKNIEIISRYKENLLPTLKKNTALDVFAYDIRSSYTDYLISDQEIWKNFDNYFS